MKPLELEARKTYAVSRDRLNDDHRELFSLLNEVRGFCASGEWLDGSHDQLFHFIESLRDRLAIHFALEEAGTLNDETLIEGNLAHEIESLRKEHIGLYEQIVQIAHDAEAMRYRRMTPRSLRRIVNRLYQFDSEFIAHESREAHLLQAAYVDDIGVGD